MRLDIVRVEGQRLLGGRDRLGALVLPGVEAGEFGVQLGGLRIERDGPFQGLKSAGRIILALEPSCDEELVIGLTGIARGRGRLGKKRTTAGQQENAHEGGTTHSWILTAFRCQLTSAHC
jgi:hypothetical protein